MIVDYNEAWPRHFREIEEYIRDVLAGDLRSVEHVGSTAVPGIVAKPIIDIHVVVLDEAAMSRAITALAEVGYMHSGDQGVPGRESFKRKGPDVPFRDPKRDWSPHHLYASIEGAREFGRHIAFRDHLLRDATDRERYVELKRSLVAEHGADREAYQLGKTEFIEAALVRAGHHG